MTLEEIGRQLRCECEAVGIADADVVIGMTDGGNGLETCLVETVLSGLALEMRTKPLGHLPASNHACLTYLRF
jgi:hypothetical protein